MINRRAFIASASAVPLIGTAQGVLAQTQRYTLRPERVMSDISGVRQPLLGFNGQLPGPTIRARQGDTFDIAVENALEEGTLVHWHGLRLPNPMDGVNVLTQDVIPPNASFNYRFKANDAGTFWYHSHYISYDQVSRGLFGALIVDEADPPDVDHDITVLLFDMLIGGDGRYSEEFPPGQFTGPGRLGNVEQALFSEQTVAQGACIRLRLLNPSVDRVYNVGIAGLEGQIVALDGMPLVQPRPISQMSLAPGQRCDIIADVTQPVVLTDFGAEIGRLPLSGQTNPRRAPLPRLALNHMPRPSGQIVTADLLLQGGDGGSGHDGFGTWALNDVSGLPRSPLADVRRGTALRLTLRNDTAFDHVMHLHGHHFWEMRDQTGEVGDYRDSTLVRAGEQRDILCVLDNPGVWMLHCHMLSHQADGMATWLRVT